MTKLSQNEKTVIKEYAGCNMNIAETARNLHHSRELINETMSMIEMQTGMDPKKFYDLTELAKEADR